MYNLTTRSQVSQTNVQLITSLIQVILSLAADEQSAKVGKLLENISCPSTQQLGKLDQKSGNI